jgi:hypothetical protein
MDYLKQRMERKREKIEKRIREEFNSFSSVHQQYLKQEKENQKQLKGKGEEPKYHEGITKGFQQQLQHEQQQRRPRWNTSTTTTTTTPLSPFPSNNNNNNNARSGNRAPPRYSSF